jgi:uncharacterized protein YjiS (DUF1127 family)
MTRIRIADWPLVLRPLSVDPLATLRLWHRRMKLRHELSRLDDAQMRDTGLDPAHVQREADKPFWQA